MKKLMMTLVLLPLMALAAVETTADGYSWTYSREGKGVKITKVSPDLSGVVTFPAKLGGLNVVSIVWDDQLEAENDVENWDVEEIYVPASLADSLTNGLMNIARNDGRERRIGGCKWSGASWGIVFGRFRALYRIDILGDSSRWAVIGESIYTKDHKTLVFQPALCGYGPLAATAKRNVWKDTSWKDLAIQMKGASFALTDEVSLKIGTFGAVTATGKFVTGRNASGKDIVHSASCSTVLVPVAEDVFRLYLCFPKKNGKFDGRVLRREALEWNGSELAFGAACREGL